MTNKEEYDFDLDHELEPILSNILDLYTQLDEIQTNINKLADEALLKWGNREIKENTYIENIISYKIY